MSGFVGGNPIDANVRVVFHKEPTERMAALMLEMQDRRPIPYEDSNGFPGFKEPIRNFFKAMNANLRGKRWCHGELVHWRKEKRRVRKLAMLNARQRRLAR